MFITRPGGPICEARTLFGLFFFSPEHALLKKKKVSKNDLANQKLWTLADGHCFRSQTLNICSGDLEKDKSYKNITFEGGQSETLKNIVKRSEALFWPSPHERGEYCCE